MILVFILCFIIAIIIVMIIFSKIEIKIHRLDISNIERKKNNDKLLIQISLKIGKLEWIKFKINKEKLAKLYVKIKQKEAEEKTQVTKEKIENNLKEAIKSKEVRKMILSTKISLEKFNANISLGSEDFILTSYLVATVAMTISNILPHIVSKNADARKVIHYRIVPIYKEENIYKIHVSMNLNTEVLHLIKIVIKIMKINKESQLKSKLNDKQNKIENNLL